LYSIDGPQGEVKIGDLGLIAKMEQKSLCSLPPYAGSLERQPSLQIKRLSSISSISTLLPSSALILAPETYENKIYNEKTDIFMFGMTVLQMAIGGKMPCEADLEKTIEELNTGGWEHSDCSKKELLNILIGKIINKCLETVEDEDIQQLVRDACNFDPNKRPSLGELFNRVKLVSMGSQSYSGTLSCSPSNLSSINNLNYVKKNPILNYSGLENGEISPVTNSYLTFASNYVTPGKIKSKKQSRKRLMKGNRMECWKMRKIDEDNYNSLDDTWGSGDGESVEKRDKTERNLNENKQQEKAVALRHIRPVSTSP
jgi:hypothetical protein